MPGRLPGYQTSRFSSMSRWVSHMAGHPAAFALAVFTIAAWALSGPVFGFSDTWQLVVNTGTTVVTFLMVFLIQNTQNRDSVALHLKIDELIRSTEGAHNALLDIEELEERELLAIRSRYARLALMAREDLSGLLGTGRPEIQVEPDESAFESGH